MFFVFNEHSVKDISPRKSAEAIITEFVRTCETARKIGFSQIKSATALKGYRLMPDLTIGRCLDQPENLSKEIITQLRSICTRNLLISEDDFRSEEMPAAEYYLTHNDPPIPSRSFAVARLYGDCGTLVVSFLTDGKWDADSVSVLKYGITEEYGTVSENHDIDHASRPVHIDDKEEHYCKLLSSASALKDWNPSENYFPRIATTNALHWEEYDSKIIPLTGGDRIALIRETGRKVSTANGYRKNQTLSQINSDRHNALRDIYEAGKGRDKIYLSVDMETGGFEVCDFRGDHLGEYKFNGDINKEKAPRHGIFLSWQ